MTSDKKPTRRAFMQRWALGAALAPLALARPNMSRAADQPLLSPEDPAAVKVKYTEDATKEPGSKGHKCSTCGLYEGTYNSTQGPCQVFPDKLVKATGWCTAWVPQL